MQCTIVQFTIMGIEKELARLGIRDKLEIIVITTNRKHVIRLPGLNKHNQKGLFINSLTESIPKSARTLRNTFGA